MRALTTRKILGAGAFVALYVLVRLPLVTLGFGNDSDAWSMASNASELVHGAYHVSRLPAHPAYEGLYSVATMLGGPLLCNLLTVGLSLALLAVVAALGEELRVRQPVWAVVALASHAIFWTASADSTDFLLATLLSTSSVLAAVRGRSHASGALLGLAAATRLETVLFAIPVAILGRDVRLGRVMAVASVVAGLLFAPPAMVLYRENWREWFSTVLLMPGQSPVQRMLLFGAKVWAAWGLVTLVVLGWILLAQRRRIVSLIRQRDRLLLAAGGLGIAYFALTVIHPSKATYYVPVLPLTLLAIVHLASTAQRVLLVLSLVTYAFVYPDVVDLVGGRLQIGFRWNNGIVVKDWIARWNTVHAARLIESNRPHGSGVLILGYWLPVWRYANAGSAREERLPDGAAIDRTLNAGYRTSDGTWVVHNLGRDDATRLSARGFALAYGEGIDAFLQGTYGYDVKSYGAIAIPVQVLGERVSEQFVGPALVECGIIRLGRLGSAGWAGCLERRSTEQEALRRESWARRPGKSAVSGVLGVSGRDDLAGARR